MKKTIETKMATNGVKLYYVDGKRTSREVALQAAADSRENLFTIEYATRHIAYFTGRILDATQVYESTSKAVLKELELKIDEYHGFTVELHTIGWTEICKLFNKDYAKSLINKIENAFIRGEYGVKIDKYGKVSILPAPVIEPNPDDYAVTEDALEVAVNAEIQVGNLIADHITGIKEEQPMTDKLIFSTKENADGKITAYYINGEKVRKCDIEYYACNHSGIIEVDYHLAQNFRALKYPGEQRKVVYTDYYGQTLMSKAAADTLGYKIVKNNSLEIFYVEPIQTDNPDDGSNDEETDLIVETKRTKRDSINLKLNGSRISLRNLEERLSNAANENFSVINQYGKKYSCYPANNYGYFGESPEGYTIHFNTLGELIEHYAVDNIIRTAEPADQPTNDPPADNRHDTEEPADNPTNDTQDTDQLIDPPELPSVKPRTLRDSINRAIKHCIRNRIGYLKSHNSKMEKYEYELLCLLQGARRELEVA